MTADNAGLALAGWLLARQMLQLLVQKGTLSKDETTAVIDMILLAMEQHQAAPDQPAAAIAVARQQFVALLATIEATQLMKP